MNTDPFSKGPKDPFKSTDPLNPSANKDIFVKRKIGGGSGSAGGARNAEMPPEPLEIPLEPLAPEPEKSKPSVILSNPKWEQEKVGFNEETEISVELSLPPEHAHKTKVTFELFAKTPNGPERIGQGEGHAEDGKARCWIPVYIPKFKDAIGERLRKVEYYFIAKHSESHPLDGSKTPKHVDEMAERLIESHILPDLTFASKQSFLHPRQAAALKDLCAQIRSWREKHPEGKLAVFGHADAVGKEDYNKALSERRAKSVHGFLIKDASVWSELAKTENWGLAGVQDLLRFLGYDPGATDGKDGPKTQAAVKAFQAKQGLPVDGQAGADTRRAMYQAMMDACNALSLKKKDFDDIQGQPTAGCSEFNLVEKSDGACEANRRVAVLLLKSTKNFPIRYPCAQGDVGACKSQVGKKGDRRTPGFGCFFYDELVQEHKGHGDPSHGQVKFIGFAEAELKQYVNMPPSSDKPDEGMERLIEVEVEGLGEGDPVYWTLTAGKDNSKRTDPKTGPKLKSGDEAKSFVDGKCDIQSQVASGKSSLLLCCGVGGGDEFTVEAGPTQDKMTAKVKIITWRKLEYETIQPIALGNDRLTDFTVFTTDKKPGLPDASKAYLSKILGQGFVEFSEAHQDQFGLSDLPEKGKYNVLDAEYVGKKAGTKFLVATPGQLDEILVQKGSQRENTRAVSMIWSDYLAETQEWRQKFTEIFNETTRNPEFSVFDKTIATSQFGMIGNFAIESLKWSASHWYDPSAPEKDRWRPIAGASDPGGAFINGGTFTSEEDIRAHIRFENIDTLSFKFPNTKDDYPGKILKRNNSGEFTDRNCVIGMSIAIKGIAYATSFNGMAINGKIWMNTFAGRVDHVGMASVIAHELGHNMGQAYGDKNADPVFGRPNDKPMPGIPFPKPVPEGSVYGDHGHRGTHCAQGIKNKSESMFSGPGNTAFSEHECAMFGAADMMDSKEFGFCPDCLGYIRAEDLSDIHKSWRG